MKIFKFLYYQMFISYHLSKINYIEKSPIGDSCHHFNKAKDYMEKQDKLKVFK